MGDDNDLKYHLSVLGIKLKSETSKVILTSAKEKYLAFLKNDSVDCASIREKTLQLLGETPEQRSHPSPAAQKAYNEEINRLNDLTSKVNVSYNKVKELLETSQPFAEQLFRCTVPQNCPPFHKSFLANGIEFLPHYCASVLERSYSAHEKRAQFIKGILNEPQTELETNPLAYYAYSTFLLFDQGKIERRIVKNQEPVFSSPTKKALKLIARSLFFAFIKQSLNDAIFPYQSLQCGNLFYSPQKDEFYDIKTRQLASDEDWFAQLYYSLSPYNTDPKDFRFDSTYCFFVPLCANMPDKFYHAPTLMPVEENLDLTKRKGTIVQIQAYKGLDDYNDHDDVDDDNDYSNIDPISVNLIKVQTLEKDFTPSVSQLLMAIETMRYNHKQSPICYSFKELEGSIEEQDKLLLFLQEVNQIMIPNPVKKFLICYINLTFYFLQLLGQLKQKKKGWHEDFFAFFCLFENLEKSIEVCKTLKNTILEAIRKNLQTELQTDVQYPKAFLLEKKQKFLSYKAQIKAFQNNFSNSPAKVIIMTILGVFFSIATLLIANCSKGFRETFWINSAATQERKDIEKITNHITFLGENEIPLLRP